MASLYEDTRDLVAAVEPTSRLAQEPTIDEPRNAMVRVHPIFISERVMPWWSRARDRFLWETLIKSDVLSSTTNVTSSRLFSIPVSVVPKNKESRRNRDLAYWSSSLLRLSFADQILPFIIDWQTQDNGAFAEIIGGGSPDGPLEPTQVPGTKVWLYGLGLRHLDAQRCTRTGDPDYPVIYEATDHKGRYRKYMLHHTRVLYMSQMKSPRAPMYGVGLSAVSRCISHALHLTDISILKEEWLGARPVSEIVFGRGFRVSELEDAFKKADMKADAEGLTRLAKLSFIGITGAPDMVRASGIERIPLKRLPEGYNEATSVEIGINMISLAYGFDAREFWPGTTTGATRADAEVSHLKTMRKTPGVWIEQMGTQLDRKWVPNACSPTFDQQDDEQDQVKADLRLSRAQELQVRIDSGQIDAIVAYQTMLEAGDINETQYNYLVKRAEELEARGESVKPNAVAAASQPDADQQEQEKAMVAAAVDFLAEQVARKNVSSIKEATRDASD